MRDIMFAGQIKNIEFASKWREKLLPEVVREGKTLGRFLAKNKNLDADTLEDIRLTKAELSLGSKRFGVLSGINKKIHPVYEKKYKMGLVNPRLRKSRLEELREKYPKKKKPESSRNSKTASSTTQTSTSKVISPSQSTKTPLLAPKAKGSSLGKIGLVGAGLLTTGAVGYGIYRKMRSDKGKKRGRYAK